MIEQGVKVTEIARELNRSREWVYKWEARWRTGDPEWYLNETKEPHNKPNKIDNGLEQTIVESRKKLKRRDTPETQYSFCGAIAIHQDLDGSGIENKPSLSTINRVLKRNDLVKTEESQVAGQPKLGKHYPGLKVRHPGHIQQLDLVTPLYISGYGKVISVNRIDVFTSLANLNQYQAKGADNIINFLISDWKEFGIPIYLQLDNEGAFRGSLYHPRTFGKLMRFCLNFGVEIIFIPFNEPWRNPYIESFNSRFNDMLWLRQTFTDLHHMRNEARKFRDKHNNYQQYRHDTFFNKSSLCGYTTSYLPTGFMLDLDTLLPITRGRIHFIRLIDEKGYITILNEPIYVGLSLTFEYVWTVINTGNQTLKIFHQPSDKLPKVLVKTLNYSLREPVKNRIPITAFLKKVSTMS